MLAFNTIVQQVTILVPFGGRFGLDIDQQRSFFLVFRACVVLEPVKIHALCFSLVPLFVVACLLPY